MCIPIDTTSAIVCTPLRPGGWTPATCQACDGDVRKIAKKVDEATHGAAHAVEALVARFDDLTTTVILVARQETRLSSAGIGGAIIARNMAYEVRARDAAYLVSFDTTEANADRLSSLAEASMAGLDALPVKSATGAGEGLVWLLRGVVAALVLVGLGWLWGRRKGRRGGGFDSRDLWPR
jgi:hypothetical protein